MEEIGLKYEVTLYWSDVEEAFIAEMPKLPGCMADGGSKAEVLANIDLVAREWIETAQELGRPIPATS